MAGAPRVAQHLLLQGVGWLSEVGLGQFCSSFSSPGPLLHFSWLSGHVFTLSLPCGSLAIYISLQLMSLVITQKLVTCPCCEHSNPPPDSLTITTPEALILFRLSQIRRNREWGTSGMFPALLYTKFTDTREDQGTWSNTAQVWRGSMNLQRCVGEKLSSYLPPRTIAAFLPTHLACKNTAGTPAFYWFPVSSAFGLDFLVPS